MKSVKHQINRREFGAYALFFAALFGGGIFAAPKLYAKNSPLRPPGAMNEREFLATCIKCGQCVQVCPYHSLKIYDIDKLNSIGTPYIDARSRGCYLCDLFPCVLACPTGSLSHDTTVPSDVKMGTAFITDIEACLAYKNEKVTPKNVEAILSHSNKNEREAKVLKDVRSFIGKGCAICAELCPYSQKQEAIEMIELEGKIVPKINKECVGCGVCAELCPSQIISIIPRKSYSEVYK